MLHCAKTCFYTWTFYIHKFWSERIFFFRWGGRGVVTARWSKWGVRDRGPVPLGSPIISRPSWQLMSFCRCQIYRTKHSGAGCCRSVVLGSTVWYLGSQSLCLSLEECQGPKAAPALSQWWENTGLSQQLQRYRLDSGCFTTFNCQEFFFSFFFFFLFTIHFSFKSVKLFVLSLRRKKKKNRFMLLYILLSWGGNCRYCY